MNIGTHVTHCCVKHGCKYSNPECPVALKLRTQQYPCEYCDYDKEEEEERNGK